MSKLHEDLSELAGLCESRDWRDFKPMHDFTRAMNRVWREVWEMHPKPGNRDVLQGFERAAMIELERNGYIKLSGSKMTLTDKGLKELAKAGNKL